VKSLEGIDSIDPADHGNAKRDYCQRALKTSQQWAQLKVENQPL
jgi:hypothetical protein